MTTLFGAKSTADEVLAGTKLINKRYLVTGVSSGIGLETARSLVACVFCPKVNTDSDLK